MDNRPEMNHELSGLSTTSRQTTKLVYTTILQNGSQTTIHGNQMKIILSRKGFDSENGGQPSPILPDGTLLSLPIPSKNDSITYSQLQHLNKSYFDIIHELKPTTKITPNYTCHLDPNIQTGLFGQEKAAQGHLRKQGVGIKDIFVFFGWFRQTEYHKSTLRYKPDAPDLHVMFGYLQVGKLFTAPNELPSYALSHPHASRFGNVNNCIYGATERLTLDETKKGFGAFRFDRELILTKDGENRSHWDLPYIFKNVDISYHRSDSFKAGYFDSAKKGQEFVIDANDEIVSYFKNIICKNAT